ncbi:MAG TPA: c-type cytochrome [Gemmatimonadaceae bacterium]|nr:c-type cytochrome [Gemmatimonadaceae bacterium]
MSHGTVVWWDRHAGGRLAVLLLLALAAVACREANGGEPRYRIAGAEPARGKVAIQRYGCGSCHTIPGVDGADGLVGPPLTSWSRRTYVAGEVPNDPDHLVQWIQQPQAIEPGTAMPNLGVNAQDARDIAAYLYTIH